VGSSTIGNFLRDAEAAYTGAQFVIDTEPESAGGEQAILEGFADIAGVAAVPHPETLEQGVVATLIGRDAIAVVVHRDNPVTSLTLEQLRRIFTGQVETWSEVGGTDLAVHPVIVSQASATRKVFRSAVLREADYAKCEVLRPDGGMIPKVAGDPGAIGQISVSFRAEGSGVRALVVGGQQPRADNPDYPITRPLYLLWWPGRETAAQFAAWARSDSGQQIVMRRFVGVGPE
jgi:phosphate transport system substrate-binding protein